MRVYLHGNCQGPAIASLLRQSCPDWDVVAYEVHSEKILAEFIAITTMWKPAMSSLSNPFMMATGTAMICHHLGFGIM